MKTDLHFTPPNIADDAAEQQAANDAARFLRALQSFSSKVNRYEVELKAIAEDITRLERSSGSTEFQNELWQLRGHHRCAARQISRLRTLLDLALRSYSCPQRRSEALGKIRKQTQQAVSSLWELRLYWLGLSATYHFMLGIVDGSGVNCQKS